LTSIVVIGDLAVDIVGNFENYPIKTGANILFRNAKISAGGVAGNMAWYLIQLEQKVFVFGSVGDDCWGDLIKNDLHAFGANHSMVKTVNGLTTGFFIILVDSKGERTMIGNRGANERINVDASELISASPSWIHLSGYTLLNSNGINVLNSVIKAANTLGINYSVDLEGIGETGAKLDLRGAIVFCNRGKCPEKSRVNAKLTVIKSGSDGCYLNLNGMVKQHKPPLVKPLNTTGAGDSFNAAFIAACIMNNDYDTACDFANVVAAYKVAQNDTRVKLPKELFRRYLNKI
jgi:ribokinase